MKTVFHSADSRGFADHGWLKARHSFSFAGYYNPQRIHFGMLRVLNDDIVDAGMGFGMHPHDNMEIVTIPLRGSLAHRDSMGNHSTIEAGEVQVMSAGKGVMHSEVNPSQTDEVNLLQIWVMPLQRNIEPRYDQKRFEPEDRKNKFQLLVSGNDEDTDALWVNQKTAFSLGDFDKGSSVKHSMKYNGNSMYFFLIEGKAEVAGEVLNRRDAIGIWEVEEIEIYFAEKSSLLCIEVPVH